MYAIDSVDSASGRPPSRSAGNETSAPTAPAIAVPTSRAAMNDQPWARK